MYINKYIYIYIPIGPQRIPIESYAIHALEKLTQLFIVQPCHRDGSTCAVCMTGKTYALWHLALQILTLFE